MYEFMILAQLSRGPMHGYMIAKIVNHIIGPFRHVQWGALYPVLGRLVQDGLIRVEDVEDDGEGRHRKVYAITESGCDRLHELLLDTEHHLGEYSSVFARKVAFFHRLTSDERLRLCRHYQVYAQQHLNHLQHKRREIVEGQAGLTDEQRHDLLGVVDHRLEYWNRERCWAEELIENDRLKEAM